MIKLVTVASVLAQNRPIPSIDARDPAAADRWAQRLHVSREVLLDTISKVGNSIAAVRRELQSA